MQGFLDDLVGDVRAVVVAGVDVRDTQLHRLAQDGHGSVTVGGWAEHVRASQLHRAVAHAGDGQTVGQSERSAGKCLRCHEKPSPCSRMYTGMLVIQPDGQLRW